MSLPSHMGPVLLFPQAAISGAGGLSGVFANTAGKNITGAPTGGIINGAEKITLWVKVSVLVGTLGILADSSPDGVNATSGGSLGSKTGITAPGLYAISYNGTPVSMIQLGWTLDASGSSATIDGIWFEGSLA